MPEVSVIVPLYRARTYIAPCVRSLKRQGLTDMEILLVDDCSPDDTYACAMKLFGDDPMVRVIRQEKNGGPGKARNRGIQEAGGRYVCFCDVDDLYVDGAVSGMFREAQKLHADVFSCSEFYLTVADPLPDDLSALREENLLKVRAGRFHERAPGTVVCSPLSLVCFRKALPEGFSYGGGCPLS